MSRWSAALIACALASGLAAQPAHAVDAARPAGLRFESGTDAHGKRMVMACADGASALAARCGVDSLDAKAPSPALRWNLQALSREQAYLGELVREALQTQLRDPQATDGIAPSASDAAALKAVAGDTSTCLADPESADVMLVCPTGRRFQDAVVMLFRGLCDRCEFRPIVVRKVN